jgi:hypothetical protein
MHVRGALAIDVPADALLVSAGSAPPLDLISRIVVFRIAENLRK